MDRSISLKCPKCGGDNISQYRGTTGPIWCLDCQHREDEKERGSFYVKSGAIDARPFNGD